MPRHFDGELRQWVTDSACPECGLFASRYDGEPCDCGDPEVEREFDAVDFADAEMDMLNKIEAEDSIGN